MRKPWVTGALLLLGTPALAEDLSPDTVAKIQHDQAAAVDKVSADHGNKKPSEMDSVERQQVIREQSKAQQGVLEKYDVDPKAYARYEATMSLDDRAAAKEASKKLDAQPAAKAETGKPAAAGTSTDANGIVIERGTAEAKKEDARAQASTVQGEGAAAGAPAKATVASPTKSAEPEKKKHRRRKKSDEP